MITNAISVDIRTYTDFNYMWQAYVDLVRAWGWKSFTIVYENSDGLVRLQELLKAHGPSELPVAVRQLPDSHDYRYNTFNYLLVISFTMMKTSFNILTVMVIQ